MRATLRRLHRYLALACALLWLSQAVTGLLMVYRWELDDAVLDAPAVPLDLAALDARIAAIAQGTPPRKVTQLWATGGVDGRLDLYADDAQGLTDIIRVDGAGNVLRTRPDGHDYAHIGLIPFAASVHQTLFAGDVGHVIVGISGLILLSSIVMGVVLAWPRKGQWRAVLLPRGARPGMARRYAWHRGLGLWLAFPAVVLISVGVMLVFYDPIERWLGEDATPVELQSVPAFTGTPVAPSQAIGSALQRFPGSQLSGAAFPKDERPWYRIRIRQPEEWRRAYGTTTIYVAAADGHVLRVDDPLKASLGRRFLDNLYPVHTGEAGGIVGRLVTLSVAAWLLAMLVLGLGLWWIRRPRRA
jgi:uncharacterized iron-regulated membrane protein